MSRVGRVLVTGAAGFIGSTLVDRLLGEGREVVGLDSLDPFYPEAQKRRNLRTAECNSRFRLEVGDIRDDGRIEALFSDGGFDAVVHLAALAGVRPSLERPAEYADVNVSGSSRIFQAALRNGVPRVVFASSSSVYGERTDGPFRETDRVDRPISPYAATKKAGELLAHAVHHTSGLPICCLRIFTCYGPRQRPDLAIRHFAERMLRKEPITIYGDGSAQRDFSYVDDVVDGFTRALDRDQGFAILNLGAGRTVSVLDMVQLLEETLGMKAQIEWRPRQPGDVSRTWADIEAARKALGYDPGVSFEEGVRRFAAWLREEA
ncbi:MAG: NAD-dependent epimerase/dehydratase family protein [Myxococcota bacterium]